VAPCLIFPAGTTLVPGLSGPPWSISREITHTQMMEQTPEPILCRSCKQALPLEAFTNHGRARKMCRPCARVRHEGYRSATTAQRLYYNVTQRLRQKRQAEVACWKVADVEQLLARWERPPELPEQLCARLRVVRVDAARAFLPDNAKVVPFGTGL
jgi:hypothetical protein